MADTEFRAKCLEWNLHMNVNNSPVPPSGIGDLYHKSDLAASDVAGSRAATGVAAGVAADGADQGIADQGINASQPAAKAAAAAAGAAGSAGAGSANDDVHLSELVRTLRSLAAESPERQARIEQLARSYISGNYHVDAPATADGIINDSAAGAAA